MAHRGDDNPVAFDVEDYTPIAHTQSRSGAALEPLHVTSAGARKFRKLGIDPLTYVGGQVEPLARGRGREDDLHGAYIAYSYNLVKVAIAKCYGRHHT
jgi:hypothetical protein